MRRLLALLLLFAPLPAPAGEVDLSVLPQFQARQRLDPGPVRLEGQAYGLLAYDRSAPGEADAFLALVKNGKLAHLESAMALTALWTAPAPGGSAPDMILQADSGGERCCVTFYAVRLRDGLVQRIETSLGGRLLADPKGGPPRLELPDAAFAYWNAPFADLPAPKLVLAWSEGRYRADAAAMRRPAPNPARIAQLADELRMMMKAHSGPYIPLGQRPDSPYDAPPAPVWGILLDQIYSGNAAAARTVFDAGWPEGKDGKDAFWTDFTTRLQQGRFWQEFGLDKALGWG